MYRFSRSISPQKNTSAAKVYSVILVMYQSNRGLNIPPGQPPGHLNFWKIFVQIPPSRGWKAVQMPHHRSIPGDQMSSMKYFTSSGQDHCYKLEGFTLFHATTLKWIPYIHSFVYTPTYPWSQMYLNIHKYTGSVKAIDLYKSYHATSVLYRIIVYIVNTT